MEAKNPTPAPPNYPVLQTQYEPCDTPVRSDPMMHKDLMTFDNVEDSLSKEKAINEDFQPGV